ncbi:hypothetical protein [Labrys neptuniae]
MKPPSKPFFVEVRRSRSVPTSTPAPQRPAPAWEETAESAGTRSRAWQHAEQFFQPRSTDPVPEAKAEPVEAARILVATVDNGAAVDSEPAAAPPSRVEAGDGAEVETGTKVQTGAKRGRKAAKPLQPKILEATTLEATTLQVAEPAVESPPRRRRQAPPAQREAAKAPLLARETFTPSPARATAVEEADSDRRKPLSAQDARSVAKPGDRWTCRLRHVRRNLGSGRLGQPRA